MGLLARDFANKQKIQRQIDIVSGVRVLGPRASVTSGDEAAPDNSFTAATITGAGGLDSGQWTVDTGQWTLDTQLTNWEQDYN